MIATALIKPQRRWLTIMSALATGWLPWGVRWEPFLTRAEAQYTLCEGYAISAATAERFIAAGLLSRNVFLGHEVLIITPAGRDWLLRNWR